MKVFAFLAPFAFAATEEEIAQAARKIGRLQGHINTFLGFEDSQAGTAEQTAKLALKNQKIWDYYNRFDLATCYGITITLRNRQCSICN